MTKPFDIKAELGRLPFLRDRGKDTPEEEQRAAFANLSPYRDGGIFGGSFSGESPWERHQQGDEIVHILDGAATLTLLADEESDPQSFDLKAGMMIVVPQGHWHFFRAPEGVTVLTVTPQPTEHLAGDDPRNEALSARL